MRDLTSRQTKILQLIIEEYIETAKPVGSEMLDKKFNLGVSPATLRNEMAELTRLGFLTQPHTSSGRAPTPQALKFYVQNLMQAKDLSVTDEVKIKEKVSDYKKEFEKALRQATHELANATKSLAVSADSEGDVYHSGTANILSMPEFYDIDLTRNVLNLLDEFDSITKIFSQGKGPGVQILMADDLGLKFLSPCAVIYQRFGQGTKFEGTIGVMGPCRLNYSRLVPAVNYFGNLIDELF